MIHAKNKIMTLGICLSLTGSAAIGAANITDADDADTIIVTAARIPTKKMATPADTTVITSRQIEDVHYSSLSEALQHVTGVTIVNSTPGALDLFRINGDDRVVVLVDGRRMNSDMGVGSGRANVNLEVLPPISAIDHIEIVRGNGSALYGSDAVGGVINIITKKRIENQSAFEVNTGNWGTQQYNLTNAGSHDKTSWFIDTGYGKQNYMKYHGVNGTTKQNNTDFRDNTLTLRVNQKINHASSLDAAYDHKSFDGNVPGAVSYPSPLALQRLTNNVAFTYHFKENTDTPAYVRYYNNYTTTYEATRFSSRTQVIDAQNTWKITDDQTLTGGLEWRKSNSSNADSGYSNKVLINQAAYLEDIIAISSKMTVTPGIRLDNNSQFGFHKTPKVAMNYQADNKTNFFASWGRVFSAPQTDDLYYNVYYSDYGYGMYGNENLKPETGYSESIGMNHRFDAKTNISVSLFKSRIYNAIRWFDDPVTYDWYVYNLNSEKKSGIDITLQKQINKAWNYDVGYSYINTKTDTGIGQGFMTDIKNAQPNGYHVGVYYAQNAWKANLQMTAGTGRNTTVYSNNSYVLWNGGVSYDASKNTTVYFKMNNITNKRYETYTGYAVGDYPMPGRYYQLGVKYVL